MPPVAAAVLGLRLVMRVAGAFLEGRKVLLRAFQQFMAAETEGSVLIETTGVGSMEIIPLFLVVVRLVIEVMVKNNS